MRRFIEKSLIMVLCLYNTYIINNTKDIVLLLLISLAISTLLDLLPKKIYRVIMYFVFIAMSLFNNQFIFYLPLILYNMYIDFSIYSFIISPLLFVKFSILNFILSIVSIYLSFIRKEYNFLIRDNKITRDSLTEDTLELREYNERLELNKEKDIHIAVLTERNRIASKLHDSIGHTISSSILQVEALKIISKDEKITDNLDILQDTLQNGMEDIRNNIHNLYSESLDLESRIHEIVESIPKLDIEFNYNVSTNLSYDLKFDILSIIKEAITNTSKHSDANQLNINLLEQSKFYSIIIKDNGSQFDSEKNLLTKGIGLLSIQEIANKYNGFLNYRFDNGFKIHISLMKG